MALAFSHTLKLHEKPMTPDSSNSDNDLKNRRRSSAKPTLRLSPVKQTTFVKESQRLSRGAWICIRAAGVIAKAQRRCELLLGDSSITSLPMDKAVGNQIPDFVLEDMTGVENADKKKDSSSISFVLKFGGGSSGGESQETTKITWVHVLKYFTHLRRYCSYASLALGNFDQAIVRAHFRSCKRAIKLSTISKYLSDNLPVFEKECIPILPMDLVASLVSSVTNKRAVSDISLIVSPDRHPNIQEDQGES